MVGKDLEKSISNNVTATCTSTQGRDSSASSGSSSETLKWHGSNSDLSTVSGGGGHRGTTTQLIAHSAKVSAPQRHHSESVLSVTDCWSTAANQDTRSSQRNFRKLFPVSTYTVQPAIVMDEKTSPKYEYSMMFSLFANPKVLLDFFRFYKCMTNGGSVLVSQVDIFSNFGTFFPKY